MSSAPYRRVFSSARRPGLFQLQHLVLPGQGRDLQLARQALLGNLGVRQPASADVIHIARVGGNVFFVKISADLKSPRSLASSYSTRFALTDESV